MRGEPMTSKNTKVGRERMIIMGVLLLVLSAPIIVFATSYMPFFHSRGQDEAAMTEGRIVHLFHSGTNDVKETIHVNDVLIVHRITPTCEVKDVGKIKVMGFIGENYIKGEVVEGEIKPDDIAKKGNVSCLVISAGVCKE
jgi:hypothetical protein